jgi:DNA-binding transcriptional MerR regulator
MRLTVKEVAKLANVTVKTLHHYHKVGLLIPSEINESGYRFYGQKEIERLQQILFFRELDFSLKDIAEALSAEADRVKVLTRQRDLLRARMKRLQRLIQTIDDSISHVTRSEVMDTDKMFAGFNEAEWKEALTEQSDYLKEKYGFDLIQENPIQVEEMNEMAQEVIKFQNTLAQALREGASHKDEKIKTLLSDHLAFLNAHGHPMDRKGLLENARFLVSDDFHRNMMEAMQVGLAYYYLAAVEAYVEE